MEGRSKKEAMILVCRSEGQVLSTETGITPQFWRPCVAPYPSLLTFVILFFVPVYPGLHEQCLGKNELRVGSLNNSSLENYTE